jgi:uncharacterized protein (TIGR02466 family)
MANKKLKISSTQSSDVKNTIARNILQPSSYFSSVIYTIIRVDLLESVKLSSEDALNLVKKDHNVNEIYPTIMSGSLSGDPRISIFENFIAQASWTILDGQGYNMTDYATYVSELWCQEHLKHSGLEQHVHPHGVLLSGFYFLDTPEDSGQMVEIHDPRPGKVQSSLPMKDQSIITESNNSLYIKPEPGLFVISNSWLPHSITRNSSNESCKFIHFNVSVIPNPNQTQSNDSDVTVV